MIGVAILLASWMVLSDEVAAASVKRAAERTECQKSPTTPCPVRKAPQLLQRATLLENRDWPEEVPAMDDPLDMALMKESVLLDTEVGRSFDGGAGADSRRPYLALASSPDGNPLNSQAPLQQQSASVALAPPSFQAPGMRSVQLLQELSEPARSVDAAGAGTRAARRSMGTSLLERARKLEAYAQARREFAQTQLAQTQLAQTQSAGEGQALGMGEAWVQKATMAVLVVLLLLLMCIAECGQCGGVRQANQMDELAAEVRRVRQKMDAMSGQVPKAVM